MDWTVAKLVEASGGRLLQGDPSRPIASVSTDTRSVAEGDCFAALIGERFDAHDFLGSAVEKGARAVVVSRYDGSLPSEVAVIEVADTLYGLGEIARYHRRRFAIPVIGLTGSNGKTSTKEMVASILGLRHNLLKNKGNLNNLIGVPLTLLGLRPDHELALIEMGISVPGEMARLVEIGGPTAGLITNIYPAHLEGLGSLDGIVREKGKLWLALPEDGLVAVNLDDPKLRDFFRQIKARAVTYSLDDPTARVRLAGPVKVEDGSSVFPISLDGEEVTVRLAVLGMHQVQNAVAAAALAFGLGESPETIARGLSGHKAVRQRMQMVRLDGGGTLVDDTYNANPGSMLAAVQAVLAATEGRPLVAVLGDMRELGPESASLHRELGRKVAALGVARLITLGEMGREIAAGARETGMDVSACRHAASHAEAVSFVLEDRPRDGWILVKGSRGMTMERIVEGILAG